MSNVFNEDPKSQITLDPENWDDFRTRAHAMLDAAVDKMEGANDGPVWTEFPPETKQDFLQPLPLSGRSSEAVDAAVRALFPYSVGNTHPRFWGWVHGSGTPSNLIAEVAAAAMNANTGGRDHGAIYVERQIVAWMIELFEFPDDASGLITSGTSIATIIAIKSARDARLGFGNRQEGNGGSKLVGYTSSQTHSCVARAFDILGLGSDALRKIPVNAAFEIDLDALKSAIKEDKAAGLTPFALIGTAGAVNVGAIDDLEALADIAERENLWLHIDGAFGAVGFASSSVKPRLKGLSRADSLAFDFHKWMHVNYDAGFVLIRSHDAHLKAFSERPEYLKGATEGLAAGDWWPVDYGPELSRSFRALKVWAHLAEHGIAKIGALVDQNCRQAQSLGRAVDAEDTLEKLAPVALNICCFRYVEAGLDDADLDALNQKIITQIQLDGLAVVSSTRVNGALAIRVNITNHRTRDSDLELFLNEVVRAGNALSAL